ncbi:MAG TPA: major capsid protein [Methylovirgula sp.]
MENLVDIFSDDAFSMIALTDALSKIDHVPGQAGAAAFPGISEGVRTTKIAIEYRDRTLAIIPTTPRGAPAPQERQDKPSLIELSIPHIQLEETITAASIQDRRGFGSSDLVGAAESVVQDQMQKMASRMDLTIEHKRLGALKGEIVDADGSVILNLFDAFNVTPPADAEFSSSAGTLRDSIMAVKRQIERDAKILLPPTARVAALCSATFFDSLTGHPDVTTAFANWEAAQANLAGDVRTGFTFGDVTWSEYRGTDDVIPGEESSDGTLVGQVGIADGECRFFLTGVPGMFSEKYAPADFFSTVNSIGLPRYAIVAMDDQLGRWVKLHVQSNPLPLCLRPATLVKGKF